MAKKIANPKLEKNVFFDINKLPPEKGLLIFPISMSRTHASQNAVSCLEYIRNFTPSKVSKPTIGLNFIYGDFLYLCSNEKAAVLKEQFLPPIINHKNSIQKIIQKNQLEFQIQHAFSYMVWNQLYLSTGDFADKLRKIKDIYKKDKKFQEYVKEDCKIFNKKPDENQINFFLEEHLMLYLLSKGQIYLSNDYIEHNEKWVLWCYPGKPLKGEVYLYQLNPFNLNWSENRYQNARYNLEDKKLYEFDRIDLETYSPK